MSRPPTLFLAVELPQAVRQQLTPLIDQLAALDRKVRPAGPEGLHLTIRFLGPVAPHEEEAVRLVAARVAQETAAFPLEVEGLGIFEKANQPQVIWAGVGAGEVELKRLAGALSSGLAEKGWPLERRPLRAHCTLARLSGLLAASSRAALAEICDQARAGPPLATRVQRMALLESVTVPGGPNRYPCRGSWPFQRS
ncbi:MAG: RNA 2',3'-cyclic phosphodiesterase [Candidatus Dormiibacterota bacterium]